MPGFNIAGSGGTVDAKTDIYRSYRWKISNLPFVDRDRWGFVIDCNLPSMDFEILKIQGMSLEYKIPSKPTFNNVEITFYDLGGLQREIETWMDKIWNPSNGLFDGKSPTDIKKNIKLDLLDNTGSSAKTYEIQGAWPKRISHSKLSMSDESLKSLIVEFVYDFYTVTDSTSSQTNEAPSSFNF